MEHFDVLVVGGGPAGSTTAYRLAEAGVGVLLVDKATFPRDKPCGGGVTMRAARLLPYSLDPVVEDRVDRLECGLRYRHHFVRHAREPLALMTQRKRLDHFLLQKAADAGADVREGVTVDARELDARIVIGADGCNGTSAKQLGLGGDVVHGVKARDIIGHSIFDRNVARLANVYTDNAVRTMTAQVLRDLCRPDIVESETVNQRAIFRQTEQPRLGIARLWLIRDSADLNEAEAERRKFASVTSVLIKAGSKTNWIRKLEAESI